MVVLIALTTQVAVDHLANWRRSIYIIYQFSTLSDQMCIRAPANGFRVRARTRKSHMPHLDPIILQIID